jgi:hypothetical protein
VTALAVEVTNKNKHRIPTQTVRLNWDNVPPI